MFSDAERVRYAKPQLIETICQLRFPTILTIGAHEPVDFQELIRGQFPRYSRKLEKLPPKMVNQGGTVKMEEQPPVTNYQFLSADGHWKVNLTSSFISLATPVYSSWEEFAAKLDQVLAQFIKVYQPAYFERIGLRYINAISRNALELADMPFSALIEPAYLGLLTAEDAPERAFTRAWQEAELNLPGGCRLKLRCGPGRAMRPGQQTEDKEIRFIFDQDLFMAGNIEMRHSAGALNTLHIHADRTFRGAITDTLHNAMEPTPL